MTKEIIYKLCIVASAWGPPNQAPNASKCVQICSFTKCLATLKFGFEVGPSTRINVLVIFVIHRVRTNPEVKMAMSKGGGLDPGARADPISPNLLLGFAARCSLHSLYKFSLAKAHCSLNRGNPLNQDFMIQCTAKKSSLQFDLFKVIYNIHLTIRSFIY